MFAAKFVRTAAFPMFFTAMTVYGINGCGKMALADAMEEDIGVRHKRKFFPSDDVFKAGDHNERWNSKCYDAKMKALEKSRIVQYMLNSLDRNGCPVDPFDMIQCRMCDKGVNLSGAMYKDDDGSFKVAMCENNLRDQKHFNTVLTHELIHVFDFCRAHVDMDNCRHHACTEIRAANLSGDCLWTAELKRGKFASSTDHHNTCVRRRATISVEHNPSCTGRGARYVDNVFDRCLRDHEPFGSVPF